MAENKKSVIVYADWIHIFEALENEEAGKLIKHFFRYVNDQNPEPEDKITKIAFESIKQALKRDLIKWEGFITKQSENGKKGGRPSNPTEPKEPKPLLEKPNKPNRSQKSLSVSVSVPVSVSDNVNESEEIKKGENFFYIGKEYAKILYKEKPSEYLLRTFQSFVEIKMMNVFRELQTEKIMSEFDKSLGNTFTDANHFKNTFVKAGKIIQKEIKTGVRLPIDRLNIGEQKYTTKW